jgi:hypothetical protein
MVQRVTDLVLSCDVDERTDREALRRFFAWVGTWGDAAQDELQGILDDYRRRLRSPR